MADIIFEALNGPWLPLTVALGGIIYFSVTYYRTNKDVNAYRNEVQQRLVDANAFSETINSIQENVYWLKNLKLGDNAKEFVLSNGKPFPKLYDAKIEICMCRLAEGSEVPSLGFAIAAEDVYHCPRSAWVQIILRPANNAADKWKVTFADKEIILCENPLMGKLQLSNRKRCDLHVGDSIELISVVTPVSRDDFYANSPYPRSFLLRYVLP